MGDPGKQLMCGSDWPLVKMKPYLKLLTELKFSQEQLENLCWRTAARLFRVDVEKLAPRTGTLPGPTPPPNPASRRAPLFRQACRAWAVR